MSGSSQKKQRRKNRNRRVDVRNKVKTSLVPTIAVVGLRFGQEARVEELCGGIAKLKFVNADHSETAFPHADAVFLLTRFIQHRWTEAAQRSFARNRIQLIPGGITGLAHRIRLKAAKIFLLNANSAEKNSGTTL